MLLVPTAEFPAYPERTVDPLKRWAAECPGRTFVARRDAAGAWVEVSYSAALARVRAIAAGLSTLELSADRPLLILSGNSIEHLMLALAALYAGVPYCPVSPAYCQLTSDLAKLRFVVELLTPGLVAAFGGDIFERAIGATVPEDTPLLGNDFGALPNKVYSLNELERADVRAADAAHAKSGPDTIAKFLLTSGSTGEPKPVITTNRMLCSNQVMLREPLPFVVDEPPVLVDWLPWNHTFGGSHNVGLVLFNGGTLYIDEGKPVPGLMDTTLQNLREISPTVYFNVPKGFELLAAALQTDRRLRETFFSRLRACFFAGAALSQHTWDQLDAAAESVRGGRVPILSGLGCTETAPSVTFTTPSNDRAGVIGLPAAGNTVKLAPVAGKLELRARGPNVTPGYWRMPDATARAFDREGYYRLGDAVRLVEQDNPGAGMIFDGRISEDFKLASGTWVSTGPLRLSLLSALAPLAQDVVIAGLNRDFIALLIVPDLRACAAATGTAPERGQAVIVADPALRQRVAAAMAVHAAQNAGNSRYAERAILLAEPLSLDRGEITDKGSVNQRTILQCRERLVEDLYAVDPPTHVICLP